MDSCLRDQLNQMFKYPFSYRVQSNCFQLTHRLIQHCGFWQYPATGVIAQHPVFHSVSPAVCVRWRIWKPVAPARTVPLDMSHCVIDSKKHAVSFALTARNPAYHQDYRRFNQLCNGWWAQSRCYLPEYEESPTEILDITELD